MTESARLLNRFVIMLEKGLLTQWIAYSTTEELEDLTVYANSYLKHRYSNDTLKTFCSILASHTKALEAFFSDEVADDEVEDITQTIDGLVKDLEKLDVDEMRHIWFLVGSSL